MHCCENVCSVEKMLQWKIKGFTQTACLASSKTRRSFPVSQDLPWKEATAEHAPHAFWRSPPAVWCRQRCAGTAHLNFFCVKGRETQSGEWCIFVAVLVIQHQVEPSSALDGWADSMWMCMNFSLFTVHLLLWQCKYPHCGTNKGISYVTNIKTSIPYRGALLGPVAIFAPSNFLRNRVSRFWGVECCCWEGVSSVIFILFIF